MNNTNNKELEIDQEEFQQSSEEVAKLASQETALVEYIPKSKAPYRMNTLIPRNMSFEVQKALNRIIREKGNIDNYVRNELKYTSTKALWKGLGAEQVDAIGLYLNQFEKDQGIIIADQTGIGKGRQAAAIIRHAVMQGYLPIFFTKKPDLFTDMYRDLKAIGHSDINPFIVNTDSNAKIRDADGDVVFSPLSSKAQYELLTNEKEYAIESQESIDWYKKIGKQLPDIEKVPTIKIPTSLDHLPVGYDMVFLTYSQVQSAHPYKRIWLENMVNNGLEGSKRYKKVIFILDESHMAGGFESIIGTWMRGVLPYTKACCYLSATFAKYPEVMPFYAKKTAILETGLSDVNFVSAMTKGGLALQEIVASNLSESGQLIRRQRSNEGIKVDYITLDKEPQRSKNRQAVNRIITLMNEVVKFEQRYITPFIVAIHTEAKRKGEHMSSKPRGLGVKQSPYFSKVFNVVDQMLFSLKVKDVVAKTIELLKEDKKVVIAFKSTMGAFLKDMNLSSGDEIPVEQLDFVRTLIKGLDGLFYYNYISIDGEKTKEHIELEELPEDGIALYHTIKKQMLLESTGLSISPIDELIDLLEKQKKPTYLEGHKDKYFRVTEVTGRNQRIRFKEGGGVVESFRSNTEKSFREFNNGNYDVLLINQSGSTGSSAHASKDFKDQRQRAMIIHQFELDINTEVQKRGRINRTGQVNLPEYYYMTSDIPIERRLMTMLKAKLKSLDANTTGSQKTNDDTLKSADFLNKYGDIVAWNWIDENQDMMVRLGYPSYKKITKNDIVSYERNDSKEGTIRQLTGRAGLLKVEDQDALYDELLDRYKAQIQLEKQQGTYDLETEFLPLDGDIKKRFLFQKGKGGATPFGKDTVRDVTIVNNLKRPFTKQEIDTRIEDILNGEKPIRVKMSLLKDFNIAYPQFIALQKAKGVKVIDKLIKDREKLAKRGSADSDKANEKISSDWLKLEELIHQKNTQLATRIAGLESTQKNIAKYISLWEVGDVVKMSFVGTTLTASWGIFLGVSIGKSRKNPYTLSNIQLNFGVADSRKMLTYSLQAAEQNYISKIYLDSKDITDKESEMVHLEWNSIIKEASSKRERRHILTENIVGTANQIGTGNKLIKYNTTNGTIKNGILMHRDYGKSGEVNTTVLPISEAFLEIKSLVIDDFFKDAQLDVTFKRISQNYFEVYLNKSVLYRAAIDSKLRSLLKKEAGQSEDELPDFVQNAGDMSGTLHIDQLENFLKRLDDFGINFLGAARELEDWEIENETQWASKVALKEGIYRYELGKAYGKGSNPKTNFISYEEPTGVYEFGVVVYSKPLSDKEKYNYTLVPIFKNVEEVYQLWKSQILDTGLKTDFNKIVESSQELPLNEAIEKLGFFIMNHPHEDGNTEFVFGRYSLEELGRIFYEDAIAEILAIDIIINQLQLAQVV